MTNLEQNQLNFINLRFGTFIHFNSASVQFHSTEDIADWEFDHENGGEEERIMLEKQEAVLNQIGLTRDKTFTENEEK